MAAIVVFLVFAATVAGVQCDEGSANRRVARRMQRLANRFNEQERSLNSIEEMVVDKFATLTDKMTADSDRMMRRLQSEISDLVASVNEVKDGLTRAICNGPPTTPRPCPEPYVGTAYGCYVLVTPASDVIYDTARYALVTTASNVTWDTASRGCQQYGGGHLVSLETEEEFKAMRNLVLRSSGTNFWTDGKNVNRQWIWATADTPFNYTNWKYGEPIGSEGCVAMFGPQTSNRLEWANYGCHHRLPNYICELD